MSKDTSTIQNYLSSIVIIICNILEPLDFYHDP
jgi:hypothetical protein